jgi:SNF2 family DNA or RNA helicase
MELTDYHAKYIAYQLTRRCPPDSVEKLAAALVDAQVDLNPHQIDAALFAFRSPLSKGALLADEVGLGKTIEAGLVLSQKWAERKRRILVIVPSNLRTQWYQELTEKFFLPCRILESKSFNTAIKQGQFRPFEAAEIVICSYQFAKSKAGDVHALHSITKTGNAMRLPISWNLDLANTKCRNSTSAPDLLRPQSSKLSPGCTRVNFTGWRLTLKPSPAVCTRL